MLLQSIYEHIKATNIDADAYWVDEDNHSILEFTVRWRTRQLTFRIKDTSNELLYYAPFFPILEKWSPLESAAIKAYFFSNRYELFHFELAMLSAEDGMNEEWIILTRDMPKLPRRLDDNIMLFNRVFDGAKEVLKSYTAILHEVAKILSIEIDELQKLINNPRR